MAVITNYAPNPSAENATIAGNGWGDFAGSGALTRSTDVASSGTYSAKYVAANAGAFEGLAGVSVGSLGWTGAADTVYVSLDVQGTGSLDTCGLRLYYTDVSIEDAGFSAVTLSGAWERKFYSATLNAAKTLDYLQILLLNSAAAANTICADRLLVTRSLVSYFDGASADTSRYVYAWSGTADASISTRTEIGSHRIRSNFELRPY
jgi:hypothetical protein